MTTTSVRTTSAHARRKRRNPVANLAPELLPGLKEDGRVVTFPLNWSEKLLGASPEQRQEFEFNAHYIFWDNLDEIIGVRNILFGETHYL